jgi:urease accessory protein
MWGAALGRPLLWALPITFPLLMVVGGVLGILGLPLPYVELGIGGSVVVLGLAILAAWRAPVPVALLIVGFFGVLHGYAHGQELPKAAAPAAFTCGFVLSTGLLHLTGVALGLITRLPQGDKVLRAAGAAIAAAGVWILLGMPGVR